MMHKRLCVGLNDNGTLIPSTDNVFDHIKNFNKDHYLSIYMYNDEQKKIFYTDTIKTSKKTGLEYKTINGAENINDVITDRIVFDFDYEKDLEIAQKDTITLCNRLFNKGIPKENLSIFFSGGKGFGVELLTDETFTPIEIKNITRELSKNLKTFDPVLFNASRILRIPYTKHHKTSLFKTPISFHELNACSIDEIKDISSQTYDPETNGVITSLPKNILALKHIKKEKVKPKAENLPLKLDLSKKPKWLSNWKYALSEGYFPEGIRDYSLLILGATYAGQGFNKLITYRILKGAAELQSLRTGQDRFPDEEIWGNIIHQIYQPGWNGGTFSEDNFPENLQDYLVELGVPRQKGEDNNALTPLSEIFNTFQDFAENIEKNTIKTGIRDLDKVCRITTNMLVGVLGSPGAGKTATVLNILNEHSLNGEASVFFSLDMGKPLVYQKMAQKFTGYNSEKVFKIFQDRDEEEKKKIRHKIETNYENVQMCFRTGASVDKMREYILDFEQKSGRKIKLIAVDYLEKLVGPFSDATANSGYNAAKLQELCNDLELCCLVLLQPQKMAGDPSEPLLTYRRVKGASVIEQDCRVIISVFREGYTPQSFDTDHYITYAVLKNTMGQLGSVDCGWNGLTGDVYELDDIGKTDLQKIRRARLEKKKLEAL